MRNFVHQSSRTRTDLFKQNLSHEYWNISLAIVFHLVKLWKYNERFEENLWVSLNNVCVLMSENISLYFHQIYSISRVTGFQIVWLSTRFIGQY